MKTKRIHKVLAGLLILAMIGFTSCKKEEVVKVFGFVQGFVYDASNNTVLDDVKVTWEVAGNQDSTTATAADGFKINDLYSGYYNLVFSKSGYSTYIYSFDVPMDDFTATAKGGANKEYMISIDPNLYPLTAGLTGRVYKTENSLYIPIEGAIVRVEINNDNLVPNMYQTTTDADGFYTFTNLPAYSSGVTVRMLEFTDANDEKYSGYTFSATLAAGGVTTMSPITLGQLTDALRLVNTNIWIAPGVADLEFPISSNITLEFNKEVSQTLTEDRGFLELQTSGGVTVPATYAYSGSMITITPDADLNVSSDYRVRYNMYGTMAYGNTGFLNVYFTTAAAK